MEFNASAPLTFGLELELQIVDATTGLLSPSSMALWPALQAGERSRHYALEATLATIELNSSVHTDADRLATEVVALAGEVRRVAQPMGLDVRGGGTQLTQFWNDRVMAPTPRSEQLAQRFGFLPKRFSTYGMHVHIGVPDGDTAVRLAAVLQALVPTFIALSAASPFLQMQDTGFCASRPLETLVYPHGGPLPRVGDWAELQTVVDEILSTGLAFSLKDIYWDVRPKPEYGTVEVRVFDTPLSVHKAVALAAFTRACAALALDGHLRLAEPAPSSSAERASRFLACRDGLDARVRDPFSARWRPARELADELFALAGRHSVCEQDARHLAALQAHCAQVQDCMRMREAERQWQVLGSEGDALSAGLAGYAGAMAGLLFEPLG
jgi:glutamate---cysteine ligase / carboxylate-amine ligase